MSSRDKKDARKILDGFEFEQTSRTQQKRGVGVRSEVRENDAVGPSRPNRRENFGASLSSGISFPALSSSQPVSGSGTPRGEVSLFNMSEVDPVTLE